MRRFLLALVFIAVASCGKDKEETLLLSGTTWTCRYMNTDYTMSFTGSSVTVSQYDYKKHRKYWDDATGSYTQNGDAVTFDLRLPVVVSQTHFLEGRISSNYYMFVKTQDYLNGKELGSPDELCFMLKENKK